MKYILSIIILSIMSICTCSAQGYISLDSCISLMNKNISNPQLRENAISQYQSQKRILRKKFTPQIDFEASATYQDNYYSLYLISSDMEFYLNADPYHYGASMRVLQTIYDGGESKLMGEMLDIDRQQKMSEIESKALDFLFKLIDHYYVALYQSEVIDNIQYRKQLVREGLDRMLLDTSSNPISILEYDTKSDQLDIELRDAYQVYDDNMKLLEILIGADIDELTDFLIPSPDFPWIDEQTLFENKCYDNEFYSHELSRLTHSIDRLSLQKQMIKNQFRPRITAFGQFSYGSFGYHPSFSFNQPLAYVGLRVAWTPIQWNKRKHQYQLIDLQTEELQMKKEQCLLDERLAHQKVIDQIQIIDRKQNQLQFQLAKYSKIRELRDMATYPPALYFIDIDNEFNISLEISKLKIDRSYLMTKRLAKTRVQ